MKYTKQPLTYEEQLENLISRGLIVKDKSFAISVLNRVSYYRLSAYCIPFQSPKDHFKKNTTFQNIYDLYRFDHDLRMIVFDALERIEIAVRTSMTYYLAHKFSAFGYLEKGNFHNSFNHENWLAVIEEEIRRSREIFIEHYKDKYAESKHFPIWMASEVFSFGRLSQLFSGLHYKDQKEIAKIYNVPRDVFRSWMHTLVYSRNLCAHHSRLWNRILAIKPTFPQKSSQWNSLFPIDNSKSIALFTIIHFLLSEIGSTFSCKEKLVQLLEQSSFVDPKAMGFPDNWQEHKIWQ
ncbi:MAG: Abi family protein [Candidatus Omnitrophica bacterium]|nr:Abi family protein [Candidatus Omnitrophota bacterium]